MQQRRFRRASFQLSAWAALSLYAGCWEGQAPPTADPRLVEQVQVSRREPLGCWPLGAVNGRGSDNSSEAIDYQAAYDDVRNKAALRGANLVVIDAVGQPRMLTHSVAVFDYSIAGRLFRCPTAGYDPAAEQRTGDELPASMSAGSCGSQCCGD